MGHSLGRCASESFPVVFHWNNFPYLNSYGAFKPFQFNYGKVRNMKNTKITFINPPELSDSAQYYSHIAIAPSGGTTIYIAGQTATDNCGSLGDKRTQMQKAFTNLRVAIEASGATPEDVVSINVLIVDYTEADLVFLAEEERALFKIGRMPTSTLIPVPRLALAELLFEINAIAVIYPDE